MKKLFLSILLLALPLLASAADVQINGIYYNYMNNATELEVTSGPGRYSGDVNIPQEVTSASRTLKITGIGYEAFRNCTSLTSVTIPNSVSSIGRYAFRGCSGLTSITIPSSVTTIFGGAFSGCSGLTSIDIPNSITRIEGATFSGCTSLSSVNIPNSVTYIGESSFYGCTSLTSVNIPNSVTTIWAYAFQKCSNLTSVYIPNSVTTIEYYAFADCNSLLSVISKMQNPCSLSGLCFSDYVYNNATLYIPKGTIEKYKSTDYWNKFIHIVEGNPFEHTLTYLVDGETYSTYTLEEGDAITPDEAPTKEGYTFSGWSEIPETMPANDVTVTGTFTVNKYKMTYMVDGVEYKSSEVEFGSAITAEENPTKEGYTFSGWSEIPETMPANDVTVMGTFTINKYTITYIIDGEVFKSMEVEYNSVITPPDAPAQEGYDFAWTDVPETMPASDITIYGTYTTGINALTNEEDERQVFTPDGKRVETPKKGLNIIRMSDGTVKKVVVK